MKKHLCLAIITALIFSLTACGTTPEPSVTAPTVSPVTQVDSDLSMLLSSIDTDYHQGVSGCSLKAVMIAGQIMDWYIQTRTDDSVISAQAKTVFDSLDVSAQSDYLSKMNDIYDAAMQTCAYNGKDLLSSAGYNSQISWDASTVKIVFDSIYTGLGYAGRSYIEVFSGDDQAEKFNISYYPVDELTPDNVLAALINMGILNEQVEVINFDGSKGRNLELDLSSAFQEQLSSLGTSGEYILLGCVVNTFLSAFGGDTLLITVQGKTLVTGHAIYDGPLTMYADNVPCFG